MCASISSSGLPTSKVRPQISDLDAEYSSLQGAITALRRRVGRQGNAPASIARELEVEAALEPLFDRCQEIAWEVAELEALSPPDLLAKVRIMLDRIEIETNDVGTALTVSLCRDLSSLLASTSGLSQHGGGEERTA